MFRYYDSYEDYIILFTDEVAAEMHARGLPAADYYWASVHDGEGLHEIVIWPKEDGDSINVKYVHTMSEKAQELYDIWMAGRYEQNYGHAFSAEAAVAEMHNTFKMKSYEHKKLVEDMEARAEEIEDFGLHWDSEEIGEEIPEYVPEA